MLAAPGKAGSGSQPCQEACNAGAAKFHTGCRHSLLLPHRALGICHVTLSSSCLTAFYKHSLLLAFKYFSSNNGKCWNVYVPTWTWGAHLTFNYTASPKLFLFVSRFVAVLLLYNEKSLISSLQGRKTHKFHGFTVERPTGWINDNATRWCWTFHWHRPLKLFSLLCKNHS